MKRQEYAKRIEKWRILIAECSNSKMSVQEWCQKKGIERRKYYYWRKKIREFDETEPAANYTKPDQSICPSSPQLTIQYGEISFHFYENADPQMLLTVISAIADAETGNIQITNTQPAANPDQECPL